MGAPFARRNPSREATERHKTLRLQAQAVYASIVFELRGKNSAVFVGAHYDNYCYTIGSFIFIVR